ncbi:MAG: GNAT family N-acetyltransferase [Clostridia bacterium]|nr:GNAT family N-acetyltransferase [Clostridia bacterium]
MPNIDYDSGGIDMLDSIKELWEQLNQHHRVLSPYFEHHYKNFTFEKRKKSLVEKAQHAELRIDLASDKISGKYVGYCISTMNNENTGEIESIFINNEYRGQGIEDQLISRALSWLGEKGAQKKTVSVSVGNEQVFAFYERYGFRPRMTMLEQV